MFGIADFDALRSDNDVARLCANLASAAGQLGSGDGSGDLPPASTVLDELLARPFSDHLLADLIKLHRWIIDDPTASIRRVTVGFRHNPGWLTRFAEPAQIAPRLDVLFCNTGSSELAPAVRAAIYYAELSDIHPFFNGNGRTARAWTGILLIQNSLPPFSPPDHRQAEHLTLLAHYSEHRAVVLFVRFFLGVLEARAVSVLATQGST